MELLLGRLRQKLQGEVETSLRVRQQYRHDASIYELLPEGIVYPKNISDIQQLVLFCGINKNNYPTLSLTPRGAGTDMSGGAISNSLIVDMTRHFSAIDASARETISAKPGAFIRDIEPLLDTKGRFIGSLPASRAWCTVGGIIGNNAGGEQSLRFGNTQHFVKELQAVLADGIEYTFKPLNKRQLHAKMKGNSFEAEIYRRLYAMVDTHYDTIRNARPKVNKNSMGYNLWDVWDREAEVFNLAPLFAGSQGTLGIITNATLKTLPKAPCTGTLIFYLGTRHPLGDIIATIANHRPAVFEGFDDLTFELGIKHFSIFKKQLGTRQWLKQQASLFGSVTRLEGHLPQMVLMVEFDGNSQREVDDKIAQLQRALASYKLRSEIAGNEQESSRFWHIRRASFQLLRERVHGKYAAPFIDDLVVPPRYLPEFLPKLRRIIRHYNLPATIAGHFGDGNLHIVPLIDIEDLKEQQKLEPILREVIPLILNYGGTLAGEHNDGMIRGPWLPAVFGNEMYTLFRQTKEIFDPMYIFNPHKKTDASWDFSMEHVRNTNK